MNLPRLDRRWAISLFIATLMFSAQRDYAQSGGFAVITGRVLDPEGASVPSATTTAKNLETGLRRTIKTTTEGLYRFEDLRPGVYDVSVESAGFSKEDIPEVKLLVGAQLDVNFDLEVAGQKQSVAVTSQVPLIETMETDISMVIDDKAVSVLPTTTSFNALGGVANDYQGLAVSAPGVKFDYSGDSSDIIGPGAVNGNIARDLSSSSTPPL
jgi:Carboxypeptidase regulatory-like domain